MIDDEHWLDHASARHLRKVFTKLGVSSRRELPAALSNLGPGGLSA